MIDKQPILTCRGLMKRYGTVVAMNGADFDLYPGEITAIIGDNGAGKSTLVKAIAGAVSPDHGEIKLHGEVLNFRGPQDAQKAGIETVYQNLALSPALSIASAKKLGKEAVSSELRSIHESPSTKKRYLNCSGARPKSR